MAVDMNRMKKERAEADRKGGSSDLGTFEQGQTLIYVCPPMYEDDPVVYLEYGQHYGLGPQGKGSVVNLDGMDLNESQLGFIKATLKKRNLTFEEVMEGAVATGAWVEKEGTQRQELRQQWMFNLICVAHRRNNRKDWSDLDWVPQIFRVSKTVYNGITDHFFDIGDISDPDAAILLIVQRDGTGIKTEYEVKVDAETLKKPMKLSDEEWDVIDVHLQPGNKGDLYKKLASFCKDHENAMKAIEGKEDDDDDKSTRSRRVTVSSASSRRKRRGASDEDDDKGEGKSETKEAKADKDEDPPKSSRRRRKKKGDDEPKEDAKVDAKDDGGDSSTKDDEPAPPPRRRRRSSESDNGEAKTSSKNDKDEAPDGDADGDGDADVDALEEALKKRSRRRRSAE